MIRKILFPIILSFLATTIYAQSVTIAGTVLDAQGEPLIGVTVVDSKETSNGTVTDFDGNFTLRASSDAVLVFSYIGMEMQEVAFDGAPMRITMLDESLEMEEFVVIGYQSVKKADLTGAVSVFKPEAMKNTIVTGTVGDALSSVPGLFTRSSAKPGGQGFVEIRGTSTFGNGTPLYVIDGVPVEGGANRDFNFNDVESIQVLKDASAAAIYGSRAANGVIIVTTKSGKEGRMKIDVSSRLTLQKSPQYDLMDAEQWIAMNDLAFYNAGKMPPTNRYDVDTDWQDEIHKMGIIQDHNISVSGGGKSSKYFFSVNYQDNSGTIEGTSSNRVTFRANSSAEHDFGDFVTFRLGENMVLSNYFVDELSCDPFWDTFRMLPTLPVYDENNYGGYGYGTAAGGSDFSNGSNPVAIEELLDVTNENFRVRGNGFAELEFLKQLKYRFNMGFEHSSDNYMRMRKPGNWVRTQTGAELSELEKRQAQYQSLVFDNTLDWRNTFGAHDISVVAGTSFTYNTYERVWGSKTDLLANGQGGYFEQLNSITNNAMTGGYLTENKLFSLFGRVNYTYDNRYLFSATVRRDQSSKFAPEYSVGTFPSVSAAWRISQEDFFQSSWVDDLKIRANYGILGSQNISAYDYLSLINVYPQVVFGDDVVHSGMINTALSNYDLKWEELHQMNVGADALFFKSRLGLSVDFFIKETQDVLTAMPILIATGNDGGAPQVNAASLKNTGVEIAASWRDKVGDFSYSLEFSGSHVQNEILEFGYGRKYYDHARTRSYVGSPIGQWYLIKTDGLFRTLEDIYNHVNSEGQMIQPNAQLGDLKYIDYNDDGQITDDDRQYCGESTPSWRFSLNTNFAYKGFDLALQFSSSIGHKIFNGARTIYDGIADPSNYHVDYDGYDAVNNPDGADPRPLYGDSRNTRGNSDRWLENGNYLRLSQAALGYTVTKDQMRGVLESVRVFVAAQNVFTITDYSGLDPEFSNGSIWERSYNGSQFPTPFGLTFGVNVSY